MIQSHIKSPSILYIFLLFITCCVLCTCAVELNIYDAETHDPISNTKFVHTIAAFGSHKNYNVTAPGIYIDDDQYLCDTKAKYNFTGHIVLARRGVCSFVIKGHIATSNGAIGLVVGNDTSDLITMGGSDNTINIPCTLINPLSFEYILKMVKTSQYNGLIKRYRDEYGYNVPLPSYSVLYTYYKTIPQSPHYQPPPLIDVANDQSPLHKYYTPIHGFHDILLSNHDNNSIQSSSLSSLSNHHGSLSSASQLELSRQRYVVRSHDNTRSFVKSESIPSYLASKLPSLPFLSSEETPPLSGQEQSTHSNESNESNTLITAISIPSDSIPSLGDSALPAGLSSVSDTRSPSPSLSSVPSQDDVSSPLSSQSLTHHLNKRGDRLSLPFLDAVEWVGSFFTDVPTTRQLRLQEKQQQFNGTNTSTSTTISLSTIPLLPKKVTSYTPNPTAMFGLAGYIVQSLFFSDSNNNNSSSIINTVDPSSTQHETEEYNEEYIYSGLNNTLYLDYPSEYSQLHVGPAYWSYYHSHNKKQQQRKQKYQQERLQERLQELNNNNNNITDDEYSTINTNDINILNIDDDDDDNEDRPYYTTLRLDTRTELSSSFILPWEEIAFLLIGSISFTIAVIVIIFTRWIKLVWGFKCVLMLTSQMSDTLPVCVYINTDDNGIIIFDDGPGTAANNMSSIIKETSSSPSPSGAVVTTSSSASLSDGNKTIQDDYDHNESDDMLDHNMLSSDDRHHTTAHSSTLDGLSSEYTQQQHQQSSSSYLSTPVSNRSRLPSVSSSSSSVSSYPIVNAPTNALYKLIKSKPTVSYDHVRSVLTKPIASSSSLLSLSPQKKIQQNTPTHMSSRSSLYTSNDDIIVFNDSISSYDDAVIQQQQDEQQQHQQQQDGQQQQSSSSSSSTNDTILADNQYSINSIPSTSTLPLSTLSTLEPSLHTRITSQISLFSTVSSHTHFRGHNNECSICLEPFITGDIIKILPCFHIYHDGCINTWLSTHNNNSNSQRRQDIIDATGREPIINDHGTPHLSPLQYANLYLASGYPFEELYAEYRNDTRALQDANTLLQLQTDAIVSNDNNNNNDGLDDLGLRARQAVGLPPLQPQQRNNNNSRLNTQCCPICKTSILTPIRPRQLKQRPWWVSLFMYMCMCICCSNRLHGRDENRQQNDNNNLNNPPPPIPRDYNPNNYDVGRYNYGTNQYNNNIYDSNTNPLQNTPHHISQSTNTTQDINVSSNTRHYNNSRSNIIHNSSNETSNRDNIPQSSTPPEGYGGYTNPYAFPHQIPRGSIQ